MTLATQGEAGTIRYNSLRGEEVALSVNFVRSYFCPKATAQEAFGFIRFCQAHQLNPFLKDAYLIKYRDGDAAQMVPGYHVWIQRAASQSSYMGFSQGIILNRDGTLERRQGAFYLPEEQVVGGWCEVEVKGRGVTRVEVAIQEYIQRKGDGAPNRFWAEKPGTMIQKVAMGQAFRLAYPTLYAGMYDSAEVLPGGDQDAFIIEAEPTRPAVDQETGEIQEEMPAKPCINCGEAAVGDEVFCQPCLDEEAQAQQQPSMMPTSATEH